MAKLNDTIKQAIEQAGLYPLATATPSGHPNVVPIKFVFIESNDELWLVDNFMDKTLKNLQQNPVAALNILIPDSETSIQIKGTVTIENQGERYQRMREQVLGVKPDAPAKSLVRLQVTEIYDCWPGEGIGQRLDD